MPEETPDTKITFTLDGREVTAEKGEMIIAAAERAGTYIPRFCYHPRMEPVGVCRMCLVEVEGPRGSTLMPSCYVAAGEGMEVITDSEKVKKAQDGVLEFLLANHPLDCPVCDKGGECPLQDQTLAHGPGETRFVEEKRHFAKPIPISELVLLDRERCIQCSRCTRFADEVAGEALIDFAGRGDLVEVSTFPGEPFSSYFSGNTVQICPVGALTATAYRFAARPWDLEQVESTCTGCAVGCRVAVQSSAGRLTRLLGVDSEPVNHSWLCDKGRFAFESVNGPDDGGDSLDITDPRRRIAEPMVRRDGELVPVSWTEALRRTVEIIRDAGADRIGAIGGAQTTNEGAFAWTTLLKGIVGTDSVDAQLGDGLDPALISALPRATIDEATRACTILLLTGDLREELPVLFLRLRAAARSTQTSVIDLAPRSTPLGDLAKVRLSARPGDSLLIARALGGDATAAAALRTHPEGRTFSDEDLTEARRLLGDDGEGVVIVLGRTSLSEDPRLVEAAARSLAATYPKATFLPALRRANVMGAIDMGLVPGLLPGRLPLDSADEAIRSLLPAAPDTAGRSTSAQLAAMAEGSQTALVLLGAEPLTDFPDAALADRAMTAGARIVAVTGHGGASLVSAEVVLPAAVAHERVGSTTNIEGRVSGLSQKVMPPTLAWPDWMIAGEIAALLGSDLGWSTVEDVTDAIASSVGTHAGVTAALLASPAAADGVVVPLTSVPMAPTALLDPTAVPGIASPDKVGLGAFAGSIVEQDHAAPGVAGPAALGLADLPAAELTDPPAPDSYSLRLVASRTLYDGGTQVVASPALDELRPDAVAYVNPYDLDRLGVTTGDEVRLRSPKASLVIEVKADEGTLRGTVAMEFATIVLGSEVHTNAVASLIDAGTLVTDVRMESL